MPGKPEVADQLVWWRYQDGSRGHTYAKDLDPRTGDIVRWTRDRSQARRFTRVEATRTLLILSEGEDVNWVVYGSETADAG